MMDENAHFKIRLSEVLKIRSDKIFLDKAEKFQNSFLKQDDQIIILRSQLADLDKFIVKNSEPGDRIASMKDSLENLRKNMMHAEKKFGKLRLDFNQYLFTMFHTSAIDKKPEEAPGQENGTEKQGSSEWY